MHRIEKTYRTTIVPALREQFGFRNVMQVPRLTKIVVNVGLGAGLKDPRFAETAEQTLVRITGQKPVKRASKKSISNFKIREGQIIGMSVTLRGARMYDFVDKLINIALPRVRDFRGIDRKTVDRSGNLSIGFREHLAFPEMKADEVEKIHGLQVTLCSTAKTREVGLAFFERLGIPFHKA